VGVSRPVKKEDETKGKKRKFEIEDKLDAFLSSFPVIKK